MATHAMLLQTWSENVIDSQALKKSQRERERERDPQYCLNSMTGSERPSPEPLLKKEASPAVLGGENSGNALEPSNALNFGGLGIPAVLLSVTYTWSLEMVWSLEWDKTGS